MSDPDRTKLPIRQPPFGGVCNRAAAAGYLGSDVFDLPVTGFSQRYAGQNEKDYPAVRHGGPIRAARSPRRRLKLGLAC